MTTTSAARVVERTRVLHLVGSAVDDFHADLSRLYARDCVAATATLAEFDHDIAYVHPGGLWSFPADLSADCLRAAPRYPLQAALKQIARRSPDVVVPQMFCLPGMTTYRSLLDLLGLAYVGNTPDVMALGAHKARAKAVVAGAGVSVPEGTLLRRGDPLPSLTLPVVVKPVDSDNSVAVWFVTEMSALEGAVDDAFTHSDEVLVERYIPLGREVRCGVIEVDGELSCLPLEEYNVDSDTKPIRAESDKLRRQPGAGADDLFLVAKNAEYAWIVEPDDPIVRPVRAAAEACHRALGCRDYSLFDFRIDPAGHPWFLEAGLYCSYSPKSVVSVMAQAGGISLPDLFRAGIRQARTRIAPA
jgi:D-alanine-D-alanine ligase